MSRYYLCFVKNNEKYKNNQRRATFKILKFNTIKLIIIFKLLVKLFLRKDLILVINYPPWLIRKKY